MIWHWWGMMGAVGFVVGCVAAWTTNAPRVFMKTLAAPLALAASRLFWPDVYPIKNSPLYVFIDFVILAISAFVGDYLLGLRLGRNGRDGYRHDSVGH